MRRAAVIGSGLGGLAAAIRLQAAGIATTIYERMDRCGGRAHGFEQDGFAFDAGPTVVTDPGCLRELFVLGGKRMADYVELLPVSPFYRLLWDDGTVFDYDDDQRALDRQIGAISLPDVSGYRAFLRYSEATFATGYLRLAHEPFQDFGAMLKVVPQLIRLGAYRSVYGVVSRFIRHPLLRQAFSFHALLVGGNPFAAPAIYTLIHALERRWGVFYPRGGTGRLVAGLARLFVDIGGRIRLRAPIARIATEAGRVAGVVVAGEPAERYDLVVSNADIVDTYAHMLGHEEYGRRRGRALGAKRFSNSLFLVHFGLRGVRPDLKHHTVVFGPRYRSLIDDIFNKGSLPADFSLYLHSPTATDPTVAPAGCSAHYALVPVPHLGRADIDWERAGPALRERVFDRLEARCLPGLRRDLVTHRIFTPRDFCRVYGAHLGSAFSLEPVLTQSAYFRPHNRDDKLRNLFFVGAGTHPGAGIPGVVASAKASVGLVLADAGMSAAA
jgi:phytoene desaturase